MQVLLDCLKSFCYLGVVLNVYIFFKLCYYSSHSFINRMFLTIFFINSFLVPMMIHFYFEVAIEHFTQESPSQEYVLGDCKAFLTIWLCSFITNYILNNGMLFCRFIYARYANGLITTGKKLFHTLVCCGTGAFLFQWLGMQPFQYHFGKGNFPMNLWKGYICTKTTYTDSLVFGDVYTNIDYLIKPKLIIISCSLLFLMANAYFTKSAYKMTRKHGIPKRKINLMT